MDDDVAVAEEHGPERTCIVTRQKLEPDRMIRFVVGPDGSVVPDIRARLPGRGAWVTGTAATVDLAVRRKSFAKAFRRELRVDEGLSAQVDALLVRDAVQALALANKAGHVVCGATKVEGALAGKPVAGVIHATQGGADGIRKIEAAARRGGYTDGTGLAHVQIFESHQLDLALGRSNVIHAALLIGGASEAFLTRATRLERFRGLAPEKSTEPSGGVASG